MENKQISEPSILTYFSNTMNYYSQKTFGPAVWQLVVNTGLIDSGLLEAVLPISPQQALYLRTALSTGVAALYAWNGYTSTQHSTHLEASETNPSVLETKSGHPVIGIGEWQKAQVNHFMNVITVLGKDKNLDTVKNTIIETAEKTKGVDEKFIKALLNDQSFVDEMDKALNSNNNISHKNIAYTLKDKLGLKATIAENVGRGLEYATFTQFMNPVLNVGKSIPNLVLARAIANATILTITGLSAVSGYAYQVELDKQYKQLGTLATALTKEHNLPIVQMPEVIIS